LQNAIDATGERGGGATDIDLDATDDASLRIAVRDEGGGIRPEVLARIFEPLFTTKPFGKGTIAVRTTAGVGSTFVVELPNAFVGARGDAA
jgi:signal transduction histidine kinase